ncbi:MAG: hypothetical protein IKF07_00270 [Eubacterium sp.]|nr:hypothetical protein [Eubacterium sp.]
MDITAITIGEFTIYEILWFFLIYSFLGWVLEVIYQAAAKGIVANRGFLNGPVCPIYGFGMIGIMLLLNSVFDAPAEKISAVLVFLIGLVVATLLELFGGWALDKLFHARWWDYSNKPFNLNGYICPEFSLYWGFGTVLAVRLLHPFVARTTVDVWPKEIGWPVAIMFFAIFIADVVITVMIVVGLNKKLEELDDLRASMRTVSDELSTALGNHSLQTVQRMEEGRIQVALARKYLEEDREKLSQDLREKVQDLLDRENEIIDEEEVLYKRITKGKIFGPRRLLRAFPDLKIPDHMALIKDLRNRL